MTSAPVAGVVPLPAPERRVLVPLTGHTIALRTLQAALGRAHANGAVVDMVQLATVSRRLALDAQNDDRLQPATAIEQQILDFGVRAQTSVWRGRTSRHALTRALATGYDCSIGRGEGASPRCGSSPRRPCHVWPPRWTER